MVERDRKFYNAFQLTAKRIAVTVKDDTIPEKNVVMEGEGIVIYNDRGVASRLMISKILIYPPLSQNSKVV